ncbi:MAG: 1,4-alpha-glucan branching protein GlgB [Ignavibacteriales bacterium]|nr:1,4-alpha-glucan branching protein GlgB [Ignavibacteriales bacterium]
MGTARRRPADVSHHKGVFSDLDIHLFREGTHFKLYNKLGCHLVVRNGAAGAAFAVWAPGARAVSVIGEFNGWNPDTHPMNARWDSSGIWEGFIPGVGQGSTYKYAITTAQDTVITKADPLAFSCEIPPKTASVVWNLEYEWGDDAWMKRRKSANGLDAPISIYEVHLGSWMRVPDQGNRSLSYRELAHALGEYVTEMGYTHVELLPVTEHPFFGSWGYQTVSYFAASGRYGTPQDLMYLIDSLHQRGIGVILDWVPSHFASDAHGLSLFDGTHLYEHADPRKGFHPDWNSCIFNYSRNEVGEFLISSALFWLEKYHVDGLRLDAVASMLYLDYSRKDGEWTPNQFGGNENLEAIAFLRTLNEAVYGAFPDVQTFAEESTAWPMVSRPAYVGGLGFGLKWNMGWMHDTLGYFSKDPVFRKHHHHQLTFSLWYAFNENFVLPVSHDEVVHGKGSLYGKMPGDEWQKFSNLRLLLGYMFGHPGKKLLFMGCDFGQWSEWNHDGSLDWHVLQFANHGGVHRWLKDLNRVYRDEAALHEVDFSPEGFEWVDAQDWENSTVSFLRKGKSTKEQILIVCNFTPIPRMNYRVGVPTSGHWKEILNSDAEIYSGSGYGNFGGVEAENIGAHGRSYSLTLTLPPLGIVFLKR